MHRVSKQVQDKENIEFRFLTFLNSRDNFNTKKKKNALHVRLNRLAKRPKYTHIKTVLFFDLELVDMHDQDDFKFLLHFDPEFVKF